MKLSKTKQYPALFATNSIDGPRDLAHLAELLKACGMSAAAWIVDEAVERAAEDSELIYSEAERDEAIEEVQAELEPYKAAFEEITEAWKEANGDYSRGGLMPEDEDVRKRLIEDLKSAAEARQQAAEDERKRGEIREGNTQRRKQKAEATK